MGGGESAENKNKRQNAADPRTLLAEKNGRARVHTLPHAALTERRMFALKL